MHTDSASAQKNALPPPPPPRPSSGPGRVPPSHFFRGVNALPRRFQKGGHFPPAPQPAAAAGGGVVSGLDGVAVLAAPAAVVVVVVVAAVVENVEAIFFWNSLATARR